MSEMELYLKGYRLTTAEILYRMPDHQHLLQSFLWQNLDLAPRFPRLMGFLEYWLDNLDGPLHSVQVTSSDLLRPAELRYASGEWKLN